MAYQAHVSILIFICKTTVYLPLSAFINTTINPSENLFYSISEEEKMLKSLIFSNNPLFGYKYDVEIFFETGKVFYKTNDTFNHTENKSFFTVSTDKLEQFCEKNHFY